MSRSTAERGAVLAALAALVSLAAWLGVLPRWPGLAHLVALPPCPRWRTIVHPLSLPWAPPPADPEHAYAPLGAEP